MKSTNGERKKERNRNGDTRHQEWLKMQDESYERIKKERKKDGGHGEKKRMKEWMKKEA